MAAGSKRRVEVEGGLCQECREFSAEVSAEKPLCFECWNHQGGRTRVMASEDEYGLHAIRHKHAEQLCRDLGVRCIPLSYLPEHEE